MSNQACLGFRQTLRTFDRLGCQYGGRVNCPLGVDHPLHVSWEEQNIHNPKTMRYENTIVYLGFVCSRCGYMTELAKRLSMAQNIQRYARPELHAFVKWASITGSARAGAPIPWWPSILQATAVRDKNGEWGMITPVVRGKQLYWMRRDMNREKWEPTNALPTYHHSRQEAANMTARESAAISSILNEAVPVRLLNTMHQVKG